MPVYASELDNLVGIVNTKDLFYLLSLKGVVVLEDALYRPLFLKPDADVADALELFRRSRRPMAVVRDATGHILGLLTMQDVLEEIVGEIEGEHDRPAPKVAPRRGGNRPRTTRRWGRMERRSARRLLGERSELCLRAPTRTAGLRRGRVARPSTPSSSRR
jgi:CBS domain containing-hemolysin-like protein